MQISSICLIWHYSDKNDNKVPEDEIEERVSEVNMELELIDFDNELTTDEEVEAKRRSIKVPVFGPFTDIFAHPLATASIAQVHRAKIMNSKDCNKNDSIGEKDVVLKIQHYGIADIIAQDLENATYLVHEFAKDKPEYQNLPPVLEEWMNEMRSELDFIKEAENTELVRSNLIKAGLIQPENNEISPNASTAATKKDEKAGVLDSASIVRIPRVIRGKVCVPHDTKELVYDVRPTTHTLVLEFIQGVKPTDEEGLQSMGLQSRLNETSREVNELSMKQREEIVCVISKAFAQQIFVDGVFSGDPHPGNILIEKSGDEFRPVLLDFGLTKHVPNIELRLAFCRLIVSAHEQDISGILAAMRDMGFGNQISMARPQMALEWIKYSFRDSKPDEDYKKQFDRKPKGGEGKEARAKREIEEAEMEFDENNSSDDETDGNGKSNPFVGSVTLAGRGAAETEKKLFSNRNTDNDKDNDGFADAKEENSSDNDEDDETNTSGVKLKDTANFDDDGEEDPQNGPKDFEGLGTIFFLLRVIGLLRGLAVKLGVSHSYLATMSPLAKQALRDGWRELQKQKNGEAVNNSKDSSDASTTEGKSTASSSIHAGKASFEPAERTSKAAHDKTVTKSISSKNMDVLGHKLVSQGIMIGASVCFFQNGKMQLHQHMGERGVADPRPVEPNTLFNSFSCSKILPVLLIHVFLDRGFIKSLDDDLSEYWPEWATGTGAKLRRLAKNSKEYRKNDTVTVRMALEHRAGLSRAFPSKLAMIGSVARERLKAGRAAGPGAALRGICNWAKMSKWIATAKPKLSEVGETHYHAMSHGWLLGGLAEAIARREPKIGTACTSYPELVHRFILKPLQIESEVRVCIDTKNFDEADRVASLALHSKHIDRSSDLFGTFSEEIQDENNTSVKEATNNPSASNATKAAPKKSANPTVSTVGLDPRIFNDPTVRSGILPAANTHFTAKGLATVFGSLLKVGSADSTKKLLSNEYLESVVHQECKRTFVENLSKSAIDNDTEKKKFYPLGFRLLKNARKQILLGSPGLVNDIGYCDLENNLSGAVLVNQLDTEARATDAILLEAVEGLENKVPPLMWRQEMGLSDD